MGVLLCSAGCTNQQNKSADVEIQGSEFEISSVITARQNVETVCYVCHSPTASPEDIIAPPLEIPKRNYLAKTSTKEEFVQKMVQFILNPSAEQSIMHSDVEQYGLMDPVGFSKDDIRAIAEYIYETDLPKPDWLKTK